MHGTTIKYLIFLIISFYGITAISLMLVTAKQDLSQSMPGVEELNKGKACTSGCDHAIITAVLEDD